MPTYGFTEYFEKEVLRKRPYLTKDMCVRVVDQPVRVERQEWNRYRFWSVRYGAELADPDGYLVRLWDERSMKEK